MVRFRKMDALRFTSIVVIICMAYVTLIVVLFAADAIHANDEGLDRNITAFPPSGQLLAFFKEIPI